MEASARTAPTWVNDPMGSRSGHPVHDYATDGIAYSVRQLAWDDDARHADYQRLRADVFVRQRHWDLPLGVDGRECDRYDVGGGRNIHVYTVCARTPEGSEQLLGGVRIFELRHWDESMISNEFLQAGVVPADVVETILHSYSPDRLIEITRLCVISSHRSNLLVPQANLAVARDLVYSGAYAAAAAAGRTLAIGLTDGAYERVMRRSHFVFETLYSLRQEGRGRLSVVLIDLVQTIHAIRAAGEHERAARMLLGCPPEWA